MKKYLLLFTALFFSLNILAQDRSFMLGISASYEVFDLLPNYINYNDGEKTRGATIGFEYAETLKILGYRAGIQYTRLKDQNITPLRDFLVFDLYIPPSTSTLHVVDFPLSGQIYLGKKRLKLYGNFGFMASLTFYKNEEYDQLFFQEEPTRKSLSFRSIYGAGLCWQFAKHFGIDLGVNKKIMQYTFEDHNIRPYDSIGLLTKLNYIF